MSEEQPIENAEHINTESTAESALENGQLGTTLAETEGETSQEDEHISSRRVGAILTAERKRLNAKHTQDMTALEQKFTQLMQGGANTNSAPQNQGYGNVIQDPLTGQWVVSDSLEGKIIIRELQKKHVDELESKRHEHVKIKRQAEEFEEKISQGYQHFDDYDKAYEQVDKLATPMMVQALAGTDNPALLINYLGKNAQEIERIKQLPAAKQLKEIYKLESALQGKPKLSTNAPAAIGNSRSTQGASTGGGSIAEREAYYRERYGQK